MTAARYLALSAVICSALHGDVLASDVPAQGLKMKMSDVTRPGQVRRSISLRSGDIFIPIPPAGSAADPTLHGGSFRIVNIAGSGESDLITLPAAHWRPVPADPAGPVSGWKFKATVSNPPTDDYAIKAILKTGYHVFLKAAIKDRTGSLLTYTLDEPMQGALEGQLSLGTQRVCVAFDTAVVTDVRNDLADGGYRSTFRAGLNANLLPCASPSGAFVDWAP